MVFCLISAEAVGEGEAGGGITGVFASHILTCPMVFGGDHHRAEDVVAVEMWTLSVCVALLSSASARL